MKWYGTVALLVLLGALTGTVIYGIGTEKIEIDFGEPRYIPKEKSIPVQASKETSILPILEKKEMTFEQCMETQRVVKMCLFHQLDEFYGQCLRQEQRNNVEFCEHFR